MKKIRKFLEKNVTKVNVAVWSFLIQMFHSKHAFAAGAASYVTPLTNLKTILLTVAAAIGGVMIVWGGINFAISFKKTNQQGEHDAILTVAAGALMVGISAVVTALG